MKSITQSLYNIRQTLARRRYLLWLLPAVLYLGLTSCETPEKVMKSPDINYKLKVATDWYNKKQYFKCIPVFEELMGLMKGQRSTEDIYFMYCMANYKQADYMIAAYHFHNFVVTYPLSEKAEEAAFMTAMSNEKLSPRYELDQTYTTKAIDAFQSFINQYPQSGRMDTANKMITLLRHKLEKKAWSNAELYYKTENYKAAAVSFENLLIQFPDIENTERILFMVVKSYDKYASNSVVLKKVDRYHSVISSYKNFIYKFPNSKYLAEASKYETDAHYYATEAAYEKAYAYIPEEREKHLNVAIRECNEQLPYIKEADRIKKTNETLQKCYLGIVRTNYDLAEEVGDTNAVKREAKKRDYYDRTIKSYYNFVDKYKDGKYIKEAEKLYALASEKIGKATTDGQK